MHRNGNENHDNNTNHIHPRYTPRKPRKPPAPPTSNKSRPPPPPRNKHKIPPTPPHRPQSHLIPLDSYYHNINKKNKHHIILKALSQNNNNNNKNKNTTVTKNRHKKCGPHTAPTVSLANIIMNHNIGRKNTHFHTKVSKPSSPLLSQSISSQSPLSISPFSLSKSCQSPLIIYNTSKPNIPQHSHYHQHKKKHTQSSSSSDEDLKTCTPSKSRQSNDYIAPLTTVTSPMELRSKFALHRDRAQAFRQRKLSDVHAAFSLKRGRLDSCMASMYKLSVDDQRILQREECKLLTALKNHDGNKSVIIDAIRQAKIEVLCNFMIFLCLMLTDVVDNKYNISAMKADVLLVLQERINKSVDLQQHLCFILKCYPQIKHVFKSMFGRKHWTNCVEFWSKIIDKKQVYEGYNFKICKRNGEFKQFENKIIDPILVNAGVIQLVAVRKILNSNAKPLLLDIYVVDKEKEVGCYGNYVSYFKYNKLCNGVLSSQIILKKGDDLRKDAACMMVFKFMNEIWKNNNINYDGKIINILTYKVIPMTQCFGCIELIADCVGLRDINSIKKDLIHDTVEYGDDLYMNNLIASAAAAYVSCLVIGIRDRHYDNQMIRKIDYKLFHIDFNFIFGEKASLDASELGITHTLAKIMDTKYKIFVELAVEAHQVLRECSQELIDFAVMAFSYLYQAKVIRQYISKKLRLNLDDDKAKNWLRKKLLKAPQNTQTVLKNAVHKIAVNLHSTSNNSGQWD